MNLFKRKAHTVIMCNLVVPFVCTGFLGIKNQSGIITGNTTEEAHEISLTASDTEPVSQYGEGEENRFAFIIEYLKAMLKQQEDTNFQIDQIDGESLAFIIEGIDSIIGNDDELSDQTEENEYAFVTQSVDAIIEKYDYLLSSKAKLVENKTTKKTTSVVSKKEVTKSISYSKPVSSASGNAIASFARQFVGLPYKHYTQGTSLKTGTDCSGFTMLIYKEFGISIPRTVGGQLGRGATVSKSNLQKGDLVFFKPKGCGRCGASHVALYIGGGQVIHETRPGRGVAITGIDGLSNIQFYAARRILNSSNTKVVEKKVEEKNKTDNNSTTIVNDGTTSEVTNKDLEKNENVNNNVVDNNVVDNNNVTSTPVATTPTPLATPLEDNKDDKTDNSKEIVQEEKNNDEKEESKKEETKKEEIKKEENEKVDESNSSVKESN